MICFPIESSNKNSYKITSHRQSMICPKIRRALITPTGNEQSQEEVVTGISDYIPHSLKSLANLNIALVGNHTQIVNQILWNEFFAKSLVKQAYYSLMQHYATEGRQTMTAVFAKYQGKVYKMDQVMDWKSVLRETMVKQEEQGVASLELQGFSNKGNIRKIAIFISKYPVSIDKLHMVIRTESIEVARISKNEYVSESGTDEFRLMMETDRTNRYRDNASSNSNTHKTKYSQISNISVKTKQSVQSKENTNNYSSKTPSRVSSKKGNKKRQHQKSFKKDIPPIKSETDPKPTFISLTPQKNTVNRQSVLAKIITSKEEQIIFLKEQLQDKNYEYEVTIREQEQTHKKEIQKITKSVKEVLDSYSHSQKQGMNENLYLKQRVRILQETMEKTNGKLQTYTQQVQGYVTHVRQLQDINSRLSNTNKKLLQEQDRHHNTQLAQMTRLNAQLLQWKQKAQDYRVKYEKIVGMMKNVINFT